MAVAADASAAAASVTDVVLGMEIVGNALEGLSKELGVVIGMTAS